MISSALLVAFMLAVFIFVQVAEWRTDLTYRIRVAFIDDEFFFPGYHLLPGFYTMAFHPKFWHMCRKSQWEQYVLARGLLTGVFRPVATEGKT